MTNPHGAIDIVVNMATPEVNAEGRSATDDTFRSQINQAPEVRRGVSIPDYIAKMDRAGIERSLLIAVRCGDMRIRTGRSLTPRWSSASTGSAISPPPDLG
jgi:hypothetical protein